MNHPFTLLLASWYSTGSITALCAVLIVLLVIYLTLVVRAIRGMMKHSITGVFLTFAFLSLIPTPPFIIMGICILVLWRLHQRDIDTIPLE